jgi:hypothetical protein
MRLLLALLVLICMAFEAQAAKPRHKTEEIIVDPAQTAPAALRLADAPAGSIVEVLSGTVADGDFGTVVKKTGGDVLVQFYSKSLWLPGDMKVALAAPVPPVVTPPSPVAPVAPACSGTSCGTRRSGWYPGKFLFGGG